MNIQLSSGSIVEIAAHGLLTLPANNASRLIAERGTLWITDTQSQVDWLIEQGDSYLPPAGAIVYVEALGDEGAVRLMHDH